MFLRAALSWQTMVVGLYSGEWRPLLQSFAQVLVGRLFSPDVGVRAMVCKVLIVVVRAA